MEFETSLKDAYPTNLKAARKHIIKENVLLVEGLQKCKNRKWIKFEDRVGVSLGKLEAKSVLVYICQYFGSSDKM